MKKLALLLFILFIPYVKAEVEVPFVNKYINNYAYYDNEKVCDTWAYDVTINKYVKINNSCIKVYETTDPNRDPNADHGRINIKIDMPNNLLNEKIIVEISTIPYNYVFELNKDNNFTIDEDVIASNYNVSLYMENHENEYEVFYPKNLNVYKNERSNIKVDYTEYEIKNKTEKKEKNEDKSDRKIIVYMILGIFALIFILIFCLFIKAKNM